MRSGLAFHTAGAQAVYNADHRRLGRSERWQAPPPPRPGAPGLEGEEAVVPAGQIDADAAGEEHQQAVGGVPVRGHDGAGGEEGGVHPQEELRRRDSVMGT